MIALPSYSDYVRRSKIIEATRGLSDFRTRMEQYFLDNRTYVGGCAGAGGIKAKVQANVKTFTFTCPTETATTYVLTATGVGAEGMGSYVYTVTQADVRATTSTGPWGQEQRHLLGDSQGWLVHLRPQMLGPRTRGFTLIELMIAVVIFAFLILLAGPMYADFIANSRIRNAGEALLNGVKQTQAEAIGATPRRGSCSIPRSAARGGVYAINPDEGRTTTAPSGASVAGHAVRIRRPGRSERQRHRAGGLTSVTFERPGSNRLE